MLNKYVLNEWGTFPEITEPQSSRAGLLQAVCVQAAWRRPRGWSEVRGWPWLRWGMSCLQVRTLSATPSYHEDSRQFECTNWDAETQWQNWDCLSVHWIFHQPIFTPQTWQELCQRHFVPAVGPCLIERTWILLTEAFSTLVWTAPPHLPRQAWGVVHTPVSEKHLNETYMCCRLRKIHLS